MKKDGMKEEKYIMINFKAELEKLAEPETDSAFLRRKDEISTAFEALNTLLAKFNKTQGAIEMQVEEMYAILEEQQEEADQEDTQKREMEQLVRALIVAADLIEDFYLYAVKSGDLQLAGQAGLMRRTLEKELTSVGLCRIADENTPFRAQLNHMEGITAAGDVPEGFITDVLRSGYIYQNKIYRKSGVLVKKAEVNTNEQNSRN